MCGLNDNKLSSFETALGVIQKYVLKWEGEVLQFNTECHCGK